MSGEGQKLLETAITKFGLSARAYNRILKVSRTIADLEGSGDIQSAHIFGGDPIPEPGPKNILARQFKSKVNLPA